MGAGLCAGYIVWGLRFMGVLLYGVTVCGSCNVWKLCCVGVAVCKICDLWELQFVGVAVRGGCNMWALRCVGVAVCRSQMV